MIERPLTSGMTWRTPVVILVCGCLIGVLGFGPRAGLGFFLTPMSSAHGWGRDVFALALAIQMLVWGAAQPFAGGDRRSLRRRAGAQRRRRALRARPRGDGLFDHARRCSTSPPAC